MHGFIDWELSAFDQVPGLVHIRLMPKGEALVLGSDRRTNILALPLESEWPRAIQELDVPDLIDPPHNMQAASSHWQAVKRDRLTQRGGQSNYRHALAHLGWRQAIQCRGAILVVIPLPENRGLALYMRQIPKLMPRPERPHPQAVKLFDLIVAFGLIDWRERWFNPTPQAQADDLAQNVRMGVSTAKGPLIVELLHRRQTQFCPGFQQVFARGAARLIRLLTHPDRIAGSGPACESSQSFLRQTHGG